MIRTTSFIAAALIAGAAQAEPAAYATAGGSIVRSGFGECVRTGAWTPPTSAEQCEPRAEVLFAFDDDQLEPADLERLDVLARMAGSGGLEQIAITGHADGLGAPGHNHLLSVRRAWTVRDYLLAKGVPEEKLIVVARGASDSITSGACDHTCGHAALVDCLQPDRRVEVRLTYRGTL